MVAFNNTLQKMITLAGARQESGGGVTIAGVSGQDFTIATKLKKVLSGHGVMDTDGMSIIFTTGIVSNGQVACKRYAPIATSADTATYTLLGY